VASVTSAGLTSSSGSFAASPALVVVPGAVLRILDVYPGIPDPTTTTTKKAENFWCYHFFCSHKYHKIVNNFIFKQVKKSFLPNH
jgi:hypothetical protein